MSLNDKIKITILWFLRVVLAIAVVWSFAYGKWELFVTALLALVVAFLPTYFERRYKVDLPLEFELMVAAFIYSALFLGGGFHYYDSVSWWDDFLHLTSGIVLGTGGFLWFYGLYLQKKLQAKPILVAFLSFSVAVMAGTLWEVFEFLVDQLSAESSLQPGLTDTMVDLILDGLGALLVNLLGFYYIKNRRKSLLSGLIDKFVKHNPHLRVDNRKT